jgi:3-methyladenine DNA glycosylase AlkC
MDYPRSSDEIPEDSYARLLLRTRDDNVHVRRLVSEGIGSPLPWARVCERSRKNRVLKDEPVRQVQRSMANNRNDIGKDHRAVCRRNIRASNSNRCGLLNWILEKSG